MFHTADIEWEHEMYDEITQRIHQFLDTASKAYYEGTPIIPDEVFDNLAHNYNYNRVGYVSKDNNKIPHTFPMYSLQKIFDDEEFPIHLKHELVQSPKLDGAAVEFTYESGKLVYAATRGDGKEGKLITHLFTEELHVPLNIDAPLNSLIQISGEMVAKEEVPNSRNYASGALGLNDVDEFNTREIYFIAYGIEGRNDSTYQSDMSWLHTQGFHTVLDKDFLKQFKQDGEVFRVNDNKVFKEMGYTAKHPRGAFARKISSDIETKPTELLEVIWQNGKGGKVTPVAIFKEIEIDSAKINRATLHNAGFVEDLDLHIGDELLITRSGGVIPKVVGKI